MEEWERHIRGEAGKSLCGETLHRFEWAFLDMEHAEKAERDDARLQPCPQCRLAKSSDLIPV